MRKGKRISMILVTALVLGLLAFGEIPGTLFSAYAYESSPIGWAGCNGLGQNGTTGGAGGTAVTVTNQEDLVKYAGMDGKYIIYVQGTIDLSPKGYAVQVKSDKTILGKGAGAVINYGGLQMKGTNRERVKNVIIRNLTIKDTYVEGDWDGKTQPWDGINLEQAHHVWIDHCTIGHHCDGALDIVKNSNYVTVSWTEFYDHNKTTAIGTSGIDTEPTRVTYHHNYFNGTNQRNPRVNGGKVHCFNNYYDHVGAQGGYISSVEKEGELHFEYNYVENCRKTLLLGDSSAGIYEANNRWIDSGTPEEGGEVFNPTKCYHYTPDAKDDVKSIVLNGAGAGKLHF